VARSPRTRPPRAAARSRSGASTARARPPDAPGWAAHTVPITALLRSPYELRLFSGAADGGAAAWDMRAKPDKPTATLSHAGAVAALHQANDTNLLAAAGDGRLHV
jgi:hypothetical protein